MGAIITTEIRPNIKGSDNINSKNPIGISMPRIHIQISSNRIKAAKKSVPKNKSFLFRFKEPKSPKGICLTLILQSTKANKADIENMETKLSAIGCMLINPR